MYVYLNILLFTQKLRPETPLVTNDEKNVVYQLNRYFQTELKYLKEKIK